MNRSWPALWLLVAVAATGCVPSPAPTIDWPLTSADVQTTLIAPLTAVKTLSGSGTVRKEEGDAVLVGDLLVTIDRERGVRLDAVTPFFTPILTLIVTPTEITALDFTRKQALIGSADEKTAELLLGLAVDPHLLAQVLIGGIDLPQAAWQPVAPQDEAEERRWVYAWSIWRVAIDPSSKRPLRLSVETADGPLVVNWEARRRVGDIEVARVIGLRRPNQRAGLRISLSEMMINESVDAGLFQATIPAGFGVQRLAGREGR